MKYKVFISGFDTLTKNIVAILLVAVVFAACVKDKDYVLDPLSAPVITQVTSSQPPDSVLTAIYPGQTVVLKGSGFVGTQKITFDNHAADDIGGHEVWSELDPRILQVTDASEGSEQCRFA